MNKQENSKEELKASDFIKAIENSSLNGYQFEEKQPSNMQIQKKATKGGIK